MRTGVIRQILVFSILLWVGTGCSPITSPPEVQDEALQKELQSARPIETAGSPQAHSGAASWQAVTATVEELVKARDLDGAVLRIARDGEVQYEKAFGDYTFDTVINVASATKWVSASVLVAVSEQGLLDLHAPLSTYMPGIAAPAGDITIDQMLSHTSGMPSLAENGIDLTLPTDISMQAAAERITALPLVAAPGTRFAYSGAGFQMAGAVVEGVTGQSWESVFQSRIAGPLGMTESYYGHPLPRSQNIRGLRNPNVQAGLHTNGNDYWKFLNMIYHHGKVGDQAVLSETAVRAMEKTRLTGVERVQLPSAAHKDAEYGFGMWCELVDADGGCPLIASSGAWGTYPWIDRRSGEVGLLIVYDRLPNVLPWVERIRHLSGEILAGEQ